MRTVVFDAPRRVEHPSFGFYRPARPSGSGAVELCRPLPRIPLEERPPALRGVWDSRAVFGRQPRDVSES